MRASRDAGAEPSVRRIGRGESLAWYACLATLAVWALGYVWWPFSNDQGNLAWVGDVIRSGGMPYRDAWDVKGPGAHLLFALCGALFGRNEWGLRLFDLAFLAIGSLSVWRIAERYAGPWGGRWAVVLYLLWYASLSHHDSAQPDGWAAATVSSAVAVMVTRARRPAPLAGGAAGALIAACTLIKPTYGLFLALPLLEGATHAGRVAGRRIVAFIGASLLGFIVPIALCVIWFAARGALGDWLDVHLRWIPTSYTALDAAWLNRFQMLASFLTASRFTPAVPFAIGGLVVVMRSRTRRDALLYSAWLAIALFGVVMQGHFYAYHWHPLYPPLAMLAGIGLHRLLRSLRMSAGPAAGASPAPVATVVSLAGAAVMLLGAALEPALHVYRLARYATGLSDAAAYDRIEFGAFGHHGGVFAELVGYLRSNSAPGDQVLVWGSGAGINYLSGRASPSPFGFVQPLVDPPDSDLRRRYRDRFLHRVTSAAPRYVVSLNEKVCERDPTPEERSLMGRVEGIMRCLRDVPALHDYVLDRYTVARVIGPLEVRQRR